MAVSVSRQARRRFSVKSVLLALTCVCFIECIREVTANTGAVLVNATQKTFVEHYDEGVEAYLDERWDDCIVNFETALLEYKKVKDVTVNCRLKCQNQVDEEAPMFPENIDNIHHYEKLVKKTLCILKCKKVVFKDRQPIFSKEALQNFAQLRSYEYLQLCYFQKNFAQKAASSVFTFLVENPDHEMMLTNLKFYTSLPDVNSDEIVNYQAHPFVALYVHGSEAYKNKDYPMVINYIEESLEEYLRAEEGCRVYCEGPFDQGWFPDYTSSMANHFTYCLKCKRKCSYQLNSLNGERHDDLLPSHYHYLQFAYFKVGNIQRACEAAVSYLLFFPVDETMLENLEYYKKLPKAEGEFFRPREEALKYVKRQEYEVKLLNYIEKEFIFQENEDEDNTVDDNDKQFQTRDLQQISSEVRNGRIVREIFRNVKPQPIIKDKHDAKRIDEFKKMTTGSLESCQNQLNKESGREQKQKEDMHSQMKTFTQIALPNSTKQQCPACNANDVESPKEKHKVLADKGTEDEDKKELKRKAILKIMKQSSIQENIMLVTKNKHFIGPHRFLVEGVALEHECQLMIQLAQVATVLGDGYGGKPSPHTEFETFEGMSIGRAALMVYFGLMEPQTLDLFFDISERGRVYVERYFNLKTRLYFNYTHLVCRTALSQNRGKGINEPHMSHPIHGDNCQVQENGTCLKISPAFTWRDYSAVIYLNDNYEGGEFFFTANHSQENSQIAIKSKCGQMVGFSSGGENLHGVRGVLQGRRCAIGLWFTLDPKYNEVERILADHVQKQVKLKGSVSSQLLKDLKLMSNF